MTAAFPPNSRYFSVAQRSRIAADGTREDFLARRIIPDMQRYGILDRYRPERDERIDLVAAEMFGDPEQYWRICDANGSEDPADAILPEGRLLKIPLPLEISGDGNA